MSVPIITLDPFHHLCLFPIHLSFPALCFTASGAAEMPKKQSFTMISCCVDSPREGCLSLLLDPEGLFLGLYHFYIHSSSQ